MLCQTKRNKSNSGEVNSSQQHTTLTDTFTHAPLNTLLHPPHIFHIQSTTISPPNFSISPHTPSIPDALPSSGPHSLLISTSSSTTSLLFLSYPIQLCLPVFHFLHSAVHQSALSTSHLYHISQQPPAILCLSQPYYLLYPVSSLS
ncbi:hypothetical protein Pmani_007067 [Petrolisthes manimaculis]|uniref:Uncharacterized protein n=1 Tax=Petrolisthes manimaculis TaxID=1843537 RepID=A0AAE1Q941_9EUCA|nr:hypothetical protein Pmani_007067 [Petrolisthes manimaculis]